MEKEKRNHFSRVRKKQKRLSNKVQNGGKCCKTGSESIGCLNDMILLELIATDGTVSSMLGLSLSSIRVGASSSGLREYLG